MTAPAVKHPHVSRIEGRWCINGTRVSVKRVWAAHRAGITFEVLFRRYPSVTRAQLLSAVAFGLDNPDVMEEELRHDEAQLDALTNPQLALFQVR